MKKRLVSLALALAMLVAIAFQGCTKPANSESGGDFTTTTDSQETTAMVTTKPNLPYATDEVHLFELPVHDGKYVFDELSAGLIKRTFTLENGEAIDTYELHASRRDMTMKYPWVRYELTEGYTKLTGYLVSVVNDTSGDSGWLEFYEGDTLLGKTEKINGLVTTDTEFEIDITGVTSITIYFCASPNGHWMFGDVTLIP